MISRTRWLAAWTVVVAGAWSCSPLPQCSGDDCQVSTGGGSASTGGGGSTGGGSASTGGGGSTGGGSASTGGGGATGGGSASTGGGGSTGGGTASTGGGGSTGGGSASTGGGGSTGGGSASTGGGGSTGGGSASTGGGGSTGGGSASTGGGSTGGNAVLFLTTTQHGGNSVGNADGICNTRASAAGLQGPFKAWVADASHTAASRFTSGGPWFTTGTSSTMVFLDANELASGTPRTRDVRDEWGAVVPLAADDFWVGGAAADENCNGWTSGGGTWHGLVSTFAQWPATSVSGCQQQRRFLCIRQ